MGSHTARFLAAAADPVLLPGLLPKLSYPEIAFAGRSNVGKSSLLNRLVGHRRLARVSKTPGRTQQINFFLIDERVTFVDLPGYGFARVPPRVRDGWKRLVEGYLTRSANLRAVVVIIDMRRGLESADVQLLQYLETRCLRPIVVATKADKLGASERGRRAHALARVLPQDAPGVVVCSAVSGAGIPALWQAITRTLAAARRHTAPR
ncbi:MAG: ribosome biogenesis GTP-binding protein YihA/YsxC [Candidatus Binatia bacterium]